MNRKSLRIPVALLLLSLVLLPLGIPDAPSRQYYSSIQPPYDPKESLNIPIMTERFIREAHAKNIRVEPWTVDDPELIRQYIKWSVDGIITARPDLMIEVLEERGIR